MAKRISQLQDLVEGVSTMKVDRTAGVIRGVLVLGRKSKNGREYSDAALRKGCGLYEGCRVNINHPRRGEETQDRGLADRFGKLQGCVVAEAGIVGDLPFLKSHPMAPQICESAERMPELMGLSHNAQGRVENRGGKFIVEEILSVRSVDLVSDPATTKSLFESRNMSKTVKEFYEAVFAAKLAGTTLLEEFPPEAMAAPVEEPISADADGDGQIDAAFKSMVNGVLDGDMDLKAKMKKIGDILKAQAKLTGEEPAAKKAPPKDDKPEDTPESLKAKIAHLEAKDGARSLLESLKVPVDETKLKALTAVAEADRKALAESWVGTKPGNPPKSGGPGAGTNINESKIPPLSALRGN